MHKSAHKIRKSLARAKKNRRCHNMGTLYGNAARLQQENVDHDRKTLWMTLSNFFGLDTKGPIKYKQKEWDK